ncbi:MAG: antibiotic biosynthesis monooxygenase [Thermaceae bacterium]
MQVQMRRYRIKEGAEEAFLKVFREVILPLRKEMGFRVLGAYLLPERGFLWFVAHEDFREAEKA